MMLLATVSALYGFAGDRRFVAPDDAPQPVGASTTLRSQLPEVPSPPPGETDAAARRRQVRHEDEERERRQRHDPGEQRQRRRASDQQAGGGQAQGDDRRKQNLPTLIDTRAAHARRRSDRRNGVDFDI